MTSLTITTEQLSQLILKHKMDLMLITQVTPMAQKMIYCFKFFADVLEMTSRLSERALENACRRCEWHKVAANNLSLHLHEIWETIKKIEKNAKDWVRLPKQPEVVLAKKLRQAREKQQTQEQKHPTSDVVEQQPTTVQQPLPLQPASLQQPPPPSQQPSAEEALQECTPQKPEMQQPQLTPQRPEPVAMPRILRKKLEGGQVEVLMPSGEAIWVPLTCGQGKCAWATLPNGQLLQKQSRAKKSGATFQKHLIWNLSERTEAFAGDDRKAGEKKIQTMALGWTRLQTFESSVGLKCMKQQKPKLPKVEPGRLQTTRKAGPQTTILSTRPTWRK